MTQHILKHLTTVKECHTWCLAQKHTGQTLALVPTMGALHAGHLALVTHALQQADRVIVSIFVNPTQFAPAEDFDAYPRNLELDIKHLTHLGAHAIFYPKTTELYSNSLNDQTLVMPRTVRQILCGQSRPHFFQGVATIVLKLLSCCQPDIAVFGEKDYQQLVRYPSDDSRPAHPLSHSQCPNSTYTNRPCIELSKPIFIAFTAKPSP